MNNPQAPDGVDADLIAAAEARGYRLAVRCRRCRSWLTDPTSVATHLGPVCSQRAGVTR